MGWDDNKVRSQFSEGDFKKVLEEKAEIEGIDDRPVGLMEIRRIFQDRSRVEFV